MCEYIYVHSTSSWWILAGCNQISLCVLIRVRKLNDTRIHSSEPYTPPLKKALYTQFNMTRQWQVNELGRFCVPVQKQGWKIDPLVSNIRSREFLFQGVQVHPYTSIGESARRGFPHFMWWKLGIRKGWPCSYFFFFGFESTQLARQSHQERTQMEVQ